MSSRVTDVRAALCELPSVRDLLPSLAGLGPPLYLVGGAVRDLLRGAGAVDLDLAVEGDAHEVALALAERLGGGAVAHEPFGTATVRADGLVVDLAATRREVYARPGALPTVERAPLAEDLARRDFTVNAMAVGLSGDDLGRLYDPSGGRADLDAGLIRVLHPASFVDDPTRLLRALRYESRLAFALAEETERLAREAAAAGAFSTVSGVRTRVELMDLLAEQQAPRAVARLAELGLDRALDPTLRADPALVSAAKEAASDVGADPGLTALAALCAGGPARAAGLRPGGSDGTAVAHRDLGSAGAAAARSEGASAGPARWIEALGLPAAERDAVMRATGRAGTLAGELREPLRASHLHELLQREPPEALALALALGAPAEPVRRYARELRSVALEISGADLLEAGVPESPTVGLALRETLRRKLDGELAGRDEELRTALALVREGT